jgi:glyoxylase-like metal-dependent hydrolase (beta-lactamase superfamily II)
MTVGTFPLSVIATPGHTAGSVCVRFRSLLFTGDTLFAGDIGRTDLYSGDEEQMIETLKLFKDLPHDLRVLPGHGPASTIGRELKVNPYLVALG